MFAATFVCGAQAQQHAGVRESIPKLDTILYGASYYNEYVPAPIRAERLSKDVALMKAAGINVVRMGESSWGKWGPKDGQFDFAWMDRIVAEMGAAGIKVAGKELLNDVNLVPNQQLVVKPWGARSSRNSHARSALSCADKSPARRPSSRFAHGRTGPLELSGQKNCR